MKKIIAIILCILTCLSIVSCNGTDEVVSETDADGSVYTEQDSEETETETNGEKAPQKK